MMYIGKQISLATIATMVFGHEGTPMRGVEPQTLWQQTTGLTTLLTPQGY